jgi:DNA-binding response OmpR family regulator
MGATLLLADDSVTIQRVIELTFADEDIRVIVAGDGQQAIQKIDAEHPDIVLADIGMPGRDGYAVAAHVKQAPHLAHIPVLLLAGAFEPVDEVRVAETGCAGVLVKPFEPQMVIARVRSLLDSRRTAPVLVADAPVAQGEAPASPARQDPSSAPHGARERDGRTPATTAPPAEPAERRAALVDDYFERLDAAFASINATLDGPSPRAAMERAGDAPPRDRVATTGAPASEGAAPLSMAEAFGVLLGVEQGEPPPLLPDAWAPVVNDDLVEQVARRVAEQVGDRVIRELAPDIVARVAERVVREEIARPRAEAEA